jgi:hypothetical protein
MNSNTDTRPIVAYMVFILVCALLSLCVGCGDLPTSPSVEKVQPVPEVIR